MDPKEAVDLILSTKLFEALTPSQANTLVRASSICSFTGGDEMYTKSSGTLAVVLHGGAEVFSADDGRNTLLRIMREGDVFGVAGLFTESEPVSRILAKGKTRILLIPKSEIISLISSNEGFAKDYISFLERRIAFLNSRIFSFTAGSCERKLAMFLCSVSDDETYSISIPFSSLAKQLDMGRASFYRALGILEDAGLVSGSDKKITVLSHSALKAKYV